MMPAFLMLALAHGHGHDGFINPLKIPGEFLQIPQQILFQIVLVGLPLFRRLERPGPRVPAITGLGGVLKNRGVEQGHGLILARAQSVKKIPGVGNTGGRILRGSEERELKHPIINRWCTRHRCHPNRSKHRSRDKNGCGRRNRETHRA